MDMPADTDGRIVMIRKNEKYARIATFYKTAEIMSSSAFVAIHPTHTHGIKAVPGRMRDCDVPPIFLPIGRQSRFPRFLRRGNGRCIC